MHKSYLVMQPQSWQPVQQWEAIGAIEGYPVAVESGTPLNRRDVFATGRTVWHNFQPEYGGNWLANWEDLGGGEPANWMVPAAAADCVYPGSQPPQLHVAYIGATGMQHKYYDANGWHPSQSGWNRIGNGMNNQGFYWGQDI